MQFWRKFYTDSLFMRILLNFYASGGNQYIHQQFDHIHHSREIRLR